MFKISNDCDEIRPSLRKNLLRNSKLCQLEQTYEQQTILKQSKDFDDAWHDVLIRDHQAKSDREKSVLSERRHKGLEVQEFLKYQMSEMKNVQAQKMHDEINKELEQIASEKKELAVQELAKTRKTQKERKTLQLDILKQIDRNNEMRMKQSESELKLEKINNEKSLQQLMKDEAMKKDEALNFKRGVFHYLDYLKKSKFQCDLEEREKEKLIADIRKQKNEDDWKRRCDLRKQRLVVNQQARDGQLLQLALQNKSKIQQALIEQEEHQRFNERELHDRNMLREEKWKNRLNAYNYGKELVDQGKNEKIRDQHEKQKLEDQLKLVAIERDRYEKLGMEFVKSSEAEFLLPLHPNLRIIKKGKRLQ